MIYILNIFTKYMKKELTNRLEGKETVLKNNKKNHYIDLI